LPEVPGLVLVATGGWEHAGHRVYLYRNARFQPRVHVITRSPGDAGQVTILSESPNRLHFSVARSRFAQTLRVGETAYGGWRAYRDGRPVPIQTTRHDFQAVAIPAEPARPSHDVELVYQPVTVVLGGFISLLALAGTVAIAACGILCRRAR
jgi:hypothetical protein